MAGSYTVHQLEINTKPLASRSEVISETDQLDREFLGSVVLSAVEGVEASGFDYYECFVRESTSELNALGLLPSQEAESSLNIAQTLFASSYFSELQAEEPALDEKTRLQHQLLSIYAGSIAHKGFKHEYKTDVQKKAHETRLARLADQAIQGYIEINGGYSLEVETSIISKLNQLNEDEKTILKSKELLSTLAKHRGIDCKLIAEFVHESYVKSTNLYNEVIYKVPRLRTKRIKLRLVPEDTDTSAMHNPNYAILPTL